MRRGRPLIRTCWAKGGRPNKGGKVRSFKGSHGEDIIMVKGWEGGEIRREKRRRYQTEYHEGGGKTKRTMKGVCSF